MLVSKICSFLYAGSWTTQCIFVVWFDCKRERLLHKTWKRIYYIHISQTWNFRPLSCIEEMDSKSVSSCTPAHVKTDQSLVILCWLFLIILAHIFSVKLNKFWFANHYHIKYRCSISMDTTVRLGPLKFSLRATIDHHGPSIHSGHNTASINCCKKHSIATITQLWSLELLAAKTPKLHMFFILYELIDTWFLDSNRRMGVWSLPWRWHILSIPLTQQVEEQAPKPVGWMMCLLLMTFVLVQKLCVNIYIYIYIFIHALPYEFCFLWFTNCVLLSDDDSLIPGCLWLLAFVSNNTFILGIWCSTIPHIPGCFCPWTYFQNIGFIVVPSDPFMSHLATQLGYSAGEFQALQLIVHATFGVVG